MLVTTEGHRGYRFGEFFLDLDRRALLRDGQDLGLRPKAVDLLEFLLQHAGTLVSRQQILEAVWPDTAVTDDSISQCLFDIRRALGDEYREQVRTVPRKGVILDAPVTKVPVQRMDPERAPAVHTPRFPVAAFGWTAIAVTLVLLLATGPWWPGMGSAPSAEHRTFDPPEHSIAVLAFDDLSPAGDSDWFAMGLAEEVLNLLAQNPELTVIARTSSFAFKGENAGIPEIAQRLNVAHVLEGSVRRDQARVRVTAQLVDARGNAHLWSQNYDGTLDDVFGVQEDIARSVAEVLHVEVLGGVPDTLADHPDPEAWSLYQRANVHYRRRGPGDLDQALADYRAATALDPGFAHAWAGISATLGVMFYDRGVPLDMLLEEAVAAGNRALELAPGDPVVLLRAARARRLEGRYEEAQALFQRAQRIDPDHPLVLGATVARHMVSDHDYQRIVELEAQAARLDPMNAVTQMNYGQSLLRVGQFELAEAHFRIALELSPEGRGIAYGIGLAKLLQGEAREALRYSDNVPEEALRWKLEAMAYHALGNVEKSERALDRLKAHPSLESAIHLSEVYAYREQPGLAIEWLDAARSQLDTDSLYDVTKLLIASQGPLLRQHRQDAQWKLAVDALRDEMSAITKSDKPRVRDA